MAAADRVSTTCIGFGADFNEDLLEPMARAGGGNYWYVESDDQMAGIFEGEIEGLVALAAQNVEVEVRLTHPTVAGVTFLQSYPVQQTGRRQLARRPARSLRHLAQGARPPLPRRGRLRPGKVQFGEVRVDADVVTAEGIEHRTTIMPVFANLDGEEHVEPAVEQTFLRFQAAKAREEAVRRADIGDFDGAAAMLSDAASNFLMCEDVPGIAEEIEDLRGRGRADERAPVRRE